MTEPNWTDQLRDTLLLDRLEQKLGPVEPVPPIVPDVTPDPQSIEPFEADPTKTETIAKDILRLSGVFQVQTGFVEEYYDKYVEYEKVGTQTWLESLYGGRFVGELRLAKGLLQLPAHLLSLVEMKQKEIKRLVIAEDFPDVPIKMFGKEWRAADVEKALSVQNPNSLIHKLAKVPADWWSKGIDELIARHPEWQSVPPKNVLDLLASPKKLANTITQSIPVLVGAGALTATGHPYAAAIIMYAAEGQESYDRAIAHGATSEQAEKARALYGSVATVIETMQITHGLKLAKGIYKPLVSTTAQRVASKSVTRKIIETTVLEQVEEMAQGTWGDVTGKIVYGEEFAGLASFLDARAQEAVVAGILTLGVGAATTTVSIPAMLQERKEGVAKTRISPAHQQIMDDLNIDLAAIEADYGVGPKAQILRAQAQTDAEAKWRAVEAEEAAAEFEKEAAAIEVEPPAEPPVAEPEPVPAVEKPAEPTVLPQEPEIVAPEKAVKPEKVAKLLAEQEVTEEKVQEAKKYPTVKAFIESQRPKKIMNVSDIDTRFQGIAPDSQNEIAGIMKAIQAGKDIPPILVSKSGYLQDGRHRLEAYKRLGIEKITVSIGIDPGSIEGGKIVDDLTAIWKQAQQPTPIEAKVVEKVAKPLLAKEVTAKKAQEEQAKVLSSRIDEAFKRDNLDEIKKTEQEIEDAPYTEELDELLGKLIPLRIELEMRHLEDLSIDRVQEIARENLILDTGQSKAELVSQIREITKRPRVAEAKIVETTVKPSEAKEKARDILGGVDPIQQIHRALKEAKAVQPLTKAQKKKELGRRVAAAAKAKKTSVKKGTPTDVAIFRSTGLLKGELTEYDQLYTSIEDILEPGAKEAAYQKIDNFPDMQYFEIVNTATSFKKLLAGAALTPTDVRNIEHVFGKVFKDVTDVRMTKSDLYDRVVAVWKAGLLTGIKTSGLNTLANVSHAMTETAKDIPAAGVDRVAALFTGERALVFTTKGARKGAVTGVVKGWKYLRTGYDERNIARKLDYKAVYFGDSKIAKGLQAYEETIFHLLGAEDQPFYYGAKARSIFSQAIAQGKNKGLKDTALDTFVEKLVAAPTDEMLTTAVYDAEVAVFQNRTNLGDLAKAFQKIKGGEIIVPFGRTPSAVAMQIISYTPAGAVKEVAEQIHAGEFNQRKFSQAFGRAAVGTGALYIGTQLLKAGLMNLSWPESEKERELWKLEGRKPNSINIGGKWRSVHVLGPVGNVLLIGGHFQKGLEDEGSPTKAVLEAMIGGAKSFTEQTFVRGVNTAADAMVSPERSFEKWFSSMAGSAVPTIVGDIARAMDEKERRAFGPIERTQIKVPIVREKLPPKIDVFGQDLPRYGGNPLEVMIDPSRPSKIRQDVVVDELRRLFDKDIKVSPTLLGDREGYDILTTQENTQLWQRAGELVYKGLLAEINSSGYKKIGTDFEKGKLLEAVVAANKEIAKMELVNIKLKQGVSLVKLAEGGLLTVEGIEMQKYFSEPEKETK